jgi:hypothetical protein
MQKHQSAQKCLLVGAATVCHICKEFELIETPAPAFNSKAATTGNQRYPTTSQGIKSFESMQTFVKVVKL